MALKTKTIAVLSAFVFIAACSSVNIQAPTGADRGGWDGAGAQ